MRKKRPQNPPQCRSCGSPQARKYAPHDWPKALRTEELVYGNWMHLERCAFCRTLWFVTCDVGPSQKYMVRWRLSIEDWQWLEALDGGASLREWHDDQFGSSPTRSVDLEALLSRRSAEASE